MTDNLYVGLSNTFWGVTYTPKQQPGFGYLMRF